MPNSGFRILTSPFTYPIVGTCNNIYHGLDIEVYPSGNLTLEDRSDKVDVTRYAPSFVFGYNLDYLRSASYTENAESYSVITNNLPVTLGSWGIVEPSTRKGYKQFACVDVGSYGTILRVYFTFFSNNTAIDNHYIVGSSQSGIQVSTMSTINPNVLYEQDTQFRTWLDNLKRQHAGTTLSLKLTFLYIPIQSSLTYPISFNVSQMIDWTSNETVRILAYVRRKTSLGGRYYLDLLVDKDTSIYIGNAPELTKLKSLSSQTTSWTEDTLPTYDTAWDFTRINNEYIYRTTHSITSGFVSLIATINGTLYTQQLAYLDTSNMEFTFEVDTTDIKSFLDMVKNAYDEGELDYFELEFAPNDMGQLTYTAGIDGGLTPLLDEDVVNRISGSLYYYQTPIEEEYHSRLTFRLDEVVDFEEDIAYIDVCPAKYYVLWEDRAGGFQCQPFNKTETFGENITRNEYATYRGSKELASVTVQPYWKVNSGWINDIYYPYYESILVSPHIELWDTVNKVKYDVRVEDSEYTEKTFKNQSRKLFNLELKLFEKEPKNIYY